MLSVSARLLDEGLDVLIVLAGTRVSLAANLYLRVCTQEDWMEPQMHEVFRGRQEKTNHHSNPESFKLRKGDRPSAPTVLCSRTR